MGGKEGLFILYRLVSVLFLCQANWIQSLGMCFDDISAIIIPVQ